MLAYPKGFPLCTSTVTSGTQFQSPTAMVELVRVEVGGVYSVMRFDEPSRAASRVHAVTKANGDR